MQDRRAQVVRHAGPQSACGNSISGFANYTAVGRRTMCSQRAAQPKSFWGALCTTHLGHAVGRNEGPHKGGASAQVARKLCQHSRIPTCIFKAAG